MFIDYSQNYKSNYSMNYDNYENKDVVVVNTIFIGGFVMYELSDADGSHYFSSFDDVLCFTADIPNLKINQGSITDIPCIDTFCGLSIPVDSTELCGEINLSDFYEELYNYYKISGTLPDEYMQELNNILPEGCWCYCDKCDNKSELISLLSCCGLGCTAHLCKSEGCYLTDSSGNKITDTSSLCNCKTKVIEPVSKTDITKISDCGAPLPYYRIKYAKKDKYGQVCDYFEKDIKKKINVCVEDSLCQLYSRLPDAKYELDNEGNIKITSVDGCETYYTNTCKDLLQYLSQNI